MATITVTQTPSDLVSVHNFNKIKWTFEPTDDTKEITSAIEIGTMEIPGILVSRDTGTTPDTFYYEVEVTEILKYFHNHFYHREVTAGVNASDLTKSISIDVIGYEDGSDTDTDTITFDLSHGVNQLGYSSGSKIKELFDMSPNLITDWNNVNFGTFTSSDNIITAATNNGAATAYSNSIALVKDHVYYLIITIAKLSGGSVLPSLYIEEQTPLTHRELRRYVLIEGINCITLKSEWNKTVGLIFENVSGSLDVEGNFYFGHALHFNAFSDMPFEAYFYNNNAGDRYIQVNTDISLAGTLDKAMNTVKYPALKVKGSHDILFNKLISPILTGWLAKENFVYAAYDDLDTSGGNITKAETTTGHCDCVSAPEYNFVAGVKYLIRITLTDNGSGTGVGVCPQLKIYDASNFEVISLPAVSFGANTIFWDCPYSFNGRLFAYTPAFTGVGLADFAMTVAIMHDSEIAQAINVKCVESCDNQVYVKYLSKEGFYRYWMFNRFYNSNVNGTKIGDVIAFIDDMVGANARHYNIGYHDTFMKLLVSSESVSKEDQRMLMDLFVSPAVYLYTGKRGADDLLSDWVLVNVEGDHQIREKNNFDTFRCTLILPESYTQRL